MLKYTVVKGKKKKFVRKRLGLVSFTSDSHFLITVESRVVVEHLLTIHRKEIRCRKQALEMKRIAFSWTKTAHTARTKESRESFTRLDAFFFTLSHPLMFPTFYKRAV